MYYVKRGQNNFYVARGPKSKEGSCVGSVSYLGLSYYDYDDPDHWNDVDLVKEAKVVEDKNNEGYDPAGSVALRGEMQRRAGKEGTPWFDNLDDLITVLDEAAEEEYNDNDRKPIITSNKVDPATRRLISDLAGLEKERWAGKRPSIDKIYDLQFKIMDSGVFKPVCDDVDYVEDQKIVAAHLLFLYTQEYQMAAREGREPNEDLLLAGSSFYNFAVMGQVLEADDEKEYEEYNEQEYNEQEYNEDDLSGMEKVIEWFLKEKGLDTFSLSGCKAAQEWLEKAEPADICVTYGPMDLPTSEVWRGFLLKVVKARTEEFLEGK